MRCRAHSFDRMDGWVQQIYLEGLFSEGVAPPNRSFSHSLAGNLCFLPHDDLSSFPHKPPIPPPPPPHLSVAPLFRTRVIGTAFALEHTVLLTLFLPMMTVFSFHTPSPPPPPPPPPSFPSLSCPPFTFPYQSLALPLLSTCCLASGCGWGSSSRASPLSCCWRCSDTG